MDVEIIIYLICFFGMPVLFALAIYLEDEGRISPKVMWLMIIGICLIPYIVSVFFMEDDFLVFWAAYTALLMITLAVIGIIVGIRKLFNK